MEIISYILSIIALAVMLASSLIKGKNMKIILILVFLGNALLSTSYLISGSLNGALTGYIASLFTIINYFFESKEKKLPMWLIVAYAATFVIINIVILSELVDLIVIATSMLFVLSIVQKNGKNYRLCSLFNLLFLVIYDLLKPSYAPLLTHAVQLAVNVAGMIIYDTKKKKS
ncbi:MAG: YgjV family protein [Ruminococcaceae bacterium]|nr:YgjV family protein [Oscillospiraceae bacterium]